MSIGSTSWRMIYMLCCCIHDHVCYSEILSTLGTWDAQSIFVGPYIAPHTNITEIDAGLDLLWRAGVTPDKVVKGEGCK